MFSDTIQTFKESISPDRTRVVSLAPLIFVFGGPAPIDNKYASCRNVFLNWAHDSGFELANSLVTPEQYPEWNQFEGYGNLVDFERDAGCLSRGILLFSECAGALAELGAFCMDEVLSERLLVVLEKPHYEDYSFIRLGPIKHIEDTHGEGAVCVVDSIKEKNLFELQVSGVGGALKAKVETLPKTHRFDPRRTRDQFLLIVDLVDLFGALTKKEIEGLLEYMGILHEPKHLKRMLNLLKMLGLIIQSKTLTQLFFVAPKNRSCFLDYSGRGDLKFERAPFKLKTTLPTLKKESERLKAYEDIHGAQTWI
ncbi:MAG: retron St85 family effector protein [Thiobacillus sp.]